jgi:hypothetical protein
VHNRPSITVGADGHGLISYYDASSGNLNVAHCSNQQCTSFTTVAAKASGDVGSHSSIAIGADGLPLIAYYYADGAQLLTSHCSNRFCVPKARMR